MGVEVRCIDFRRDVGNLSHVNIGDVSPDVLIDAQVLKHHLDLPLHSHLVHDINDDVNAQDFFVLVLDAHVVNDFLDLVELT